MKIKLNSYILLFRLLDILSNNKWVHKLVVNRKVYLGASIISLTLMNNACSSDNADTNNKKEINFSNKNKSSNSIKIDTTKNPNNHIFSEDLKKSIEKQIFTTTL